MLQDAILRFYAHNLIEKDDLRKIRKLFEEIDTNGDGLLSYEEVHSVMESMGRAEESQKIFGILDYEKTKVISYEEFIKALLNRKQLEAEKNIKKCFDALDEDKNGRLSINELRKISSLHMKGEAEGSFKEIFYSYSNGKHYVRVTS